MLCVNDVYPCIQGEGCLTGTPMVLVRLQGCSVRCAYCDTKETWEHDGRNMVSYIHEAQGTNPNWTLMDAEALARCIQSDRQGCDWVLLTGGEPAEHERRDLKELVTELHLFGFKVAIETSGTARGHLDAGFDWVCVSPKIAQAGGLPILNDVVATAGEIKMVVGKPDDIMRLECLLNEVEFQGTVCLQPMSTSAKATALCVEWCMKRGWRLSLQTHKFIGER